MATRVLDLVEEARALRPAVAEVDPALRSAVQRTWRGRMIREHGSAPVFEALGEQLRRLGSQESAEAAWAACQEMAAEERRHGALCGAVVEAFGGDARAEVVDEPPLPEHDDVAPLEGAVRNVLSICCLSETVAVALISAERLEMPEGDLRRLLSTILADEVGHARFGWRWLAEMSPGLDAAARVRLGEYLRVAFAAQERHQLSLVPEGRPFPPGAAALGLCDGGAARELFYDTVNEVIVPRLEALGIPAETAWRRRGLT
ncbi:ferritin-like domain-containing protein [Chondromyces crocatus]|uniref:Ferritin-like domain-containing protein n=1 Tax=Chondromyces crocatus TaxID=52 RepID=A0A0K1ESH9_CHOCO|nr:ferritin-like domain-containing protein [Chondromyces crocatus]AKT43895.1 uncharacterized protein CMC5_081320 [Chondromyces crocatus]